MTTQTTQTHHRRDNSTAHKKPSWFSPDILFLAGLTAILNLHLVGKGTIQSSIFLPAAVKSGEWWRLFTHPFVHITWYHLLLDAGAFFMLYAGLEDNRISHRLTHLMICGISSLATAWLFTPAIDIIGLCGLSGIAHGLMAISGLEMMQEKGNFKVGLGCLVLVVAKSVYEIYINDTLFAFLQFGLCGTPLVACHAGGVIGGVLSFFLLRDKKTYCFQKSKTLLA